MDIPWGTSVLLVLQFAGLHSAHPSDFFVQRANLQRPPDLLSTQQLQSSSPLSSACPLPPPTCPNGWTAVCTTSSAGYPTYFCINGAFPSTGFPDFGQQGSRSLLLPDFQTDGSTPTQKVTPPANSYPPEVFRQSKLGFRVATKLMRDSSDGLPPAGGGCVRSASPQGATGGIPQLPCSCLYNLCYNPPTVQPGKPTIQDSSKPQLLYTETIRSVDNLYNPVKRLVGENAKLPLWVANGYIPFNYNPEQPFPSPLSFSKSQNGLPVGVQGIPQSNLIPNALQSQHPADIFQKSKSHFSGGQNKTPQNFMRLLSGKQQVVSQYGPSPTQDITSVPRLIPPLIGSSLPKTSMFFSGNQPPSSNVINQETGMRSNSNPLSSALPAGQTFFNHYYDRAHVPGPWKSIEEGSKVVTLASSNVQPVQQISSPQYTPQSKSNSKGFQASQKPLPQDLPKFKQPLPPLSHQNSNRLPPSLSQPDSRPSDQLNPKPSQSFFSWILNSIRSKILPKALSSSRSSFRQPFLWQGAHLMGSQAQNSRRNVPAKFANTRPLPYLNSGLSLLSDDGEAPYIDGQRSVGLLSTEGKVKTGPGRKGTKSRRKSRAKHGKHANKKHESSY